MIGTTKASRLNVRASPDLRGRQIGQLAAGTVVHITGSRPGWFEIRYRGRAAFVSAGFVDVLNEDWLDVIGDTGPGLTSPRPVAQDQAPFCLMPERKLPVAGTEEERSVAATWNRFGRLLEHFAGEKGVEPACAVAVLCVESSGRGFDSSNGGRMIVRFENHKFWTYWGRTAPEKFRAHFTCDTEQPWRGHCFRRDETVAWTPFHGHQGLEWQVLTFAQDLDEEAALKSTSMGAPQIMGFHHERIGYGTAKEMFAAFQRGIALQVMGFFEFLTEPMVQCLKARSFRAFAGLYNGTGQMAAYGCRIENHYQAFKRIC